MSSWSPQARSLAQNPALQGVCMHSGLYHCFEVPHRNASTDMRHDLSWSRNDLDVRSSSDLDICEVKMREERSCKRKLPTFFSSKAFHENYIDKNCNFTRFWLWILNRWSELNSDEILTKELFKIYRLLFSYRLRPPSYHSFLDTGTFSEKKNRIIAKFDICHGIRSDQGRHGRLAIGGYRGGHGAMLPPPQNARKWHKIDTFLGIIIKQRNFHWEKFGLWYHDIWVIGSW